ncbi:hypothetical protein K523DRAFT_89963 [Schizophyllum commune Tattone D]|nr:hypothetical protein K523DRAFT_89963 [Schizophyllum commune Tattone D]
MLFTSSRLARSSRTTPSLMHATCGTLANRPPLLLLYTTSSVQGCQHPFRWTPASSGASAPCTIRALRPSLRTARTTTSPAAPHPSADPDHLEDSASHPRMRCAHPCAHSVLHALHTLALSPSSVSHPSRYPSPSSHLGFVVSRADSSGFRIRFASLELLDSDSRNGDDGCRLIRRRVRPLALLCLLTASPNSGKRLPLDEFVALDIRLRLGVFAQPSACTPRPMYEQLQYRLALLCYARLPLLCIDVERHILYSFAMYLVYTTSSRPPNASIACPAR